MCGNDHRATYAAGKTDQVVQAEHYYPRQARGFRYRRWLADDENIESELEPIVRDLNYKHPDRLRNLSTKIAAECAIGRAEDPIEQIK